MRHFSPRIIYTEGILVRDEFSLITVFFLILEKPDFLTKKRNNLKHEMPILNADRFFSFSDRYFSFQ